MEENNQKQTPPTDSVPVKKSWLKWGLVAAVLVAVAFYFFSNKETSRQDAEPKKAVFHRDEPAQGQILQDDFKEKILEMLDSGMSVAQISKETGVRRDVVRKLKKEHNK